MVTRAVDHYLPDLRLQICGGLEDRADNVMRKVARTPTALRPPAPQDGELGFNALCHRHGLVQARPPGVSRDLTPLRSAHLPLRDEVGERLHKRARDPSLRDLVAQDIKGLGR